MATDRTTENHVYAALREKRQRRARWVYRLGIPLVIIASVAYPEGIWIWVLAWFVSLRATKCAASSIKLAGAAGEDRALLELKRLPEQYTLFNQLKLPDERSRTGYRETDFVVVGPNGVFIIENKDFRGEIQGDGNAAVWEVRKTGIGGTRYSKSCRNPVRQVRVYVAILSRLFSARGIGVRLTPLVSLSRNNSLVSINSDKVQVIAADDLCEIILAHKGKLSEENLGKVLNVLEELRSGNCTAPQG